MSVKSRFLAILTALTLLAIAATSPGTMAQTGQEATLTAEATTASNLYGVSETGLYIVRFKEPALASYTGGIASLAATSPQATGAKKLDANSAASQAYLAYLQAQHDQFAVDMARTLGRAVNIEASYLAALNGMAVEVSHAEAAKLAEMPGVAAVYGDTLREVTTDVGPELIQAPAIWDGDTGPGVATRGEGIIVGIIDSGINFGHPSFAATSPGDGYVHTNPYGAGVYNGWCATNPGFCNDKLIGAYFFNGPSPVDQDGHGSHVGGTVAGNVHDAVFMVGTDTYTRTVSGVAPRANIVAYRVCAPSCPSSASVSAVNSAITTDNVDVLNYSISGSDFPWADPVDLAFLDASNAGIFVSASAGNSGPGPNTVAKTGPWNASVAASTHSRAIGHTLDVTSQGDPAPLQGLFVVPAEGTVIGADINSGIRYDATNNLGCTPFTPGTFTGNLALIQRGGCTFAVKATNAQNAGATGVVLFQSVGGPPLTAGGNPAPPMVMMDLASGIALRDHIIANPTDTTVRINTSTSLVFVPEWEDIVGGFSSRGPSQYEILKPDYIAPGVNILAAVAESGGDPVQYGFLQGTSMSSPHAAGAAALMVALHPTWSPAEIRSALASSAVNGLFKEDGLTLADPFDVGSGRLDLSLASTVGLVFDENGANYLAADPATGGDPKTLNQPSMVNYNCLGTCTFTRTVTSVLPVSADYTVSGSGPAGMSFTFNPITFTIAPSATQEIVITVDASGLPVGDVAFGSVSLETDAIHTTLLNSPMNVLLSEDFSGTFPPTDWGIYKLAGTGSTTWIRDTVQSNSAPASARRIYGAPADGNQIDWLVTPPITLDMGTSTLTYADRGDWTGFYGYSGVWVSNASCDPADGDFVELRETDDLLEDAWRTAPAIDLTDYAGDQICIGFLYEGLDAHTWWIDDVTVTSLPAGSLPVASNNLPVVVIPALPVPVISVDPTELDASQPVDTQTTQTLTISNGGGVNLDWTIAEEPMAVRLGLSLEESNTPSTSPYSLILDDGSGENAIGVGGAQFIWLNRFTPSAFNFPITLDEIQVMFGYPSSTGGIVVGQLVDIYLYEDADGNPANGATHVATLNDQAVQAVNGTTWSVYSLGTPVTFNGPGDIIVAVVNRTAGVTPGTFPAAIDQNSGSQQRSWAGFGVVPGNPPDFTAFPNFGIIDSFGGAFAGNWLVRGFGTGQVPCTNPANVPWLSVAPAAGTTGPESSTDVTVTFDSTGLTPGDTYNAFLCIESNDPAMPLVEVPVTLEVANVPTIETDTTAISMTVSSGQVTHMMTISNTGFADLNWSIDTAEPISVGPVPASVLNLPVGSDRASGTTTSATAAPQAILPTSSAVMSGSWSEEFDDITTLPGMGWASINNSAPVGTSSWFQGNNAVFPSHTGASNSYIGANFNNTAGTGTISNWLLTPEITMRNGDSFSFWTRRTTSAWQDRLQVRLSTNGGSTDVGATATSVGDFTELLLDINPTYAAGGYPQVWTQYTINISGLSEATNGRIAFRYFVESGGPSGDNSDYIGIDTFEYVAIEACDMPAAISWLSVDPTSGTTAAGDADMVTVTMDATGLALGTHEAVLCVNSDDPATPVIEIPVSLTVAGDARLRVAHLAPFAMDPGTAVTVTLNGNPTLTDVAFGDSTTYLTVPAGEYLVEIFPGSSNSAAISAIVTLMPDMDYSAVAIGGANNWDLALKLYEDDNTAPAAGFAHVRFGHLAPFADGATATLADIRTDSGTIVVDDVPFDTLATYMPLAAGEYDLQVTSADGSVVYMDLAPFTLADGDILYAVAAGDGANQDLGVFAWFTDQVGIFLPLEEPIEPTTYGVELHAAVTAITGDAGTTVTYTVHITNTGNMTDTFDLALSGNDWTTNVQVSIELGAGQMSMFYVTVQIPANAADGDNDTVTVTATSTGDNTESDSVTLTTTAEVEPVEPPTPTIYLPLIFR